jgi:hypothetical protein
MAWTETEVAAIFQKVSKVYNNMMELNMEGTGGGPGADENFHNWMQHDNPCVVAYLFVQHSKLYLSLVKMWDRSYGYVFVDKKDQFLDNVGIGDIYSSREVGFDDANYDAVSKFTSATPRQRSRLSSVEVDMEQIKADMRDTAAARKESSGNQKKILTLLKGNVDSSAGEVGNMNDIEQTWWVEFCRRSDKKMQRNKKSRKVQRVLMRRI